MRRRRRLARSIRHPPPAVASLHAAPSAAPNFPPPPLNPRPFLRERPSRSTAGGRAGHGRAAGAPPAPRARQSHRQSRGDQAQGWARRPRHGLRRVQAVRALGVRARGQKRRKRVGDVERAADADAGRGVQRRGHLPRGARSIVVCRNVRRRHSRATGVRGVARVGPGDGDARGTPTVARQRTRRRFISERNRGGDRRVHAAAAGRAALAPRARAASCVRRVPIRVPRRLSAPARSRAAFDPRAASLRRAVAAAAAAPARSPLALHGTPVAADVGP